VLGYRISGPKLRHLREETMKRTQRQLGDIIGRSDVAVRRYETQATTLLPVESVERLAAHLNRTVETLIAQLAIAGVDGVAADGVGDASPLDEHLPNVAPYSERLIAEPIPFFELCVAAGHWVDVIDNEEVGHRVTDAQVRQGLFRVRLRGDSMTPRFPDGGVVEFRLLRTPDGHPDFEATVAGECYYVQKTDGTATFKCLESRDMNTLTLRALNRQKYRKPLICEVEDVVRLAAFEWVLSKGE
jgi:SOS-response transcriptional repressor LexA